MSLYNRLATALAIAAGVVSLAHAQTSSTSRPANSPPTRRSIVQHYPYPYPEYYHGDNTAGFRNPGGVGRYTELYPAGNQFQTQSDPVRVANFDRGGGAPNRAEQLQALQIGVQRENAIMNHIDNYARPAFGMGYFGGYY